MEIIILSFSVTALVVSAYFTGYGFGKVAGMKWARDVYNGKYEHEIFKDKLDT